MLRVFLFSLAVLLFSTANVYGQTGTVSKPSKKNHAVGFYGKRFFMQFGGGMHHNTLLKIASNKEKNLRDNYFYSKYRSQIKKDQFNYSVYGSMGVVLKERFALAVDVNYYYGDIFLTGIGRKEYYDQFGYLIYTAGYDARVKYNTLRIMPRIEIGSSHSNMPAGLVNVLGMGIELSRLKSGTYKSIASNSSQYSTDSLSVISDRPLSFKDEAAFNLTMMYGLEYRLPLSKNIAWNFGGYVHVNIPIQELIDEDIFGFSSGYNYNDYEDQYKRQMSRYRLQNLFSVRTGIVIML
ncbi:hypothetical protein D3C87_199810 [compost metagenome]